MMKIHILYLIPILLDMLHQEGVEGDNEDYRKVRQWKKTLKLKSSYNTEKLRCATLVFLFAKTSLHRAIDDSFSTHFVKAGLRNIDEFVREFASDAVGAVHEGGPLLRPLPHGGRHEDSHRGSEAGHQPRHEPPHGQAHQDLHERGPGQAAHL